MYMWTSFINSIVPIFRKFKINLGTFMSLFINFVIYFLIIKFVGYQNLATIDKIFIAGCFVSTTGILHYVFNRIFNTYKAIKNEKRRQKLKKDAADKARKDIYRLLDSCSSKELELFKQFVKEGTTIHIDYENVNIVKDLVNKDFKDVLGFRYRLNEGSAYISSEFYYVLKDYFI